MIRWICLCLIDRRQMLDSLSGLLHYSNATTTFNSLLDEHANAKCRVQVQDGASGAGESSEDGTCVLSYFTIDFRL